MSLGGQLAITEGRTELKFSLGGQGLAKFRAGLAGRVPEYHHGGGSSALSGLARHFTSTVYFDTANFDIFRAARSGAPHVKLRGREYYDVLPLDELAVDVDELCKSAPILWLELKTRDGDESGKRRVGVPKRRLSHFLHSPEVDPELRSIQEESLGSDGAAVLSEMLEFLKQVGAPLEASCIINYARASWQSDDGALRITVDEELCVFAPQAAVLERDVTLSRERLGTPAWKRTGAIVEVKTLGSCPDWLRTMLADCGARQTSTSKFITGTLAVTEPRHPDLEVHET